MKRQLSLPFMVSVLIFSSLPAHAWGRRGHALVCQTAALLLSEHAMLRARQFDLEYFCNVPDLVWKKPATYKVEWFNHFMDLENFDRAFRSSKIKAPFAMSRKEFNHAFPEVKNEAGRAYWRIRELDHRLAQIANHLRDSSLSHDARHESQHDWLVTAGALGHYVGDLSQPLHVTENYNGQLSGQTGIHAYFEDVMVDQLFNGIIDPPGQLATEVAKQAKLQWNKLPLQGQPVVTLALIEKLAEESAREVPGILKTDQMLGRKSDLKSAKAYRERIIQRLAAGSVALAQLWEANLSWSYDGEKFFDFNGAPDYIPAED